MRGRMIGVDVQRLPIERGSLPGLPGILQFGCQIDQRFQEMGVKTQGLTITTNGFRALALSSQ